VRCLAAVAASTLMTFSAVWPGHQSQQPPAVCAGSIAIAGAGVSWLRDKLQVMQPAVQMHNARKHCVGMTPLAVVPSIEAPRASPTAQVISSAAESEELAASVEDTAGVYFVPAFSGLLAPRWRSETRGVIVGLTSYSTKASAVTLGFRRPCAQPLVSCSRSRNAVSCRVHLCRPQSL
jgi:glycerol kinase